MWSFCQMHLLGEHMVTYEASHIPTQSNSSKGKWIEFFGDVQSGCNWPVTTSETSRSWMSRLRLARWLQWDQCKFCFQKHCDYFLVRGNVGKGRRGAHLEGDCTNILSSSFLIGTIRSCYSHKSKKKNVDVNTTTVALKGQLNVI